MHDDDEPVGRMLNRREVVRLLALGGVAVVAGCKRSSGMAVTSGADTTGATLATASGTLALPACVVRPELVVGPYFLDHQVNRSDIRSDPTSGAVREGTPLALTFNVSRVDGGTCAPLAGAMVDVWHCDARGEYSGVDDHTIGFNTLGQKFLRGYQVTDPNGRARFSTIYPGWYQGRAVHIHFKIRTPLASAQADDRAHTYEFTSQLFFDDALTDRVLAKAPYASRGARDVRNADDRFYPDGGSQLVLAAAPVGTGYRASFDVGLDLTDADVGKADRPGEPGGSAVPPLRARPPRPRPSD
jgi:protocatechuate 3,4-dioxygenase beta subunit